MTKVTQRKKRRVKPKVLSAAEKALNKLQNDHRASVRALFKNAGFQRVTGVSDKEFEFDNQRGDIDDIFVYENVVIFAEYTCTQSAGIGEHLKKKKLLFDKILENKNAFIDLIKTKFPACVDQLPTIYHSSKIIVKILYCSRNDFDDHYKVNVPGPVYMDYPAVRYFASVAESVRRSSRFELLDFMGVAADSVGVKGRIEISRPSNDYDGSLLPEAHSHFDDGFKVVSFYVDPEILLRTAYVLRKDGWRDSINLYQRMISKSKIESIRNYLKDQKRVFINNIIVTLPPEVRPVDEDLRTVDSSTLTKTAAVKIKLPNKPNSIGIIDGQHRVFAYHETLNDDPQIALLRTQQNLLVTGIIYPEGLPSVEREKFEARLFLEINSNQTNAKSQLKQAIGVVLDPYSVESIATRVLTGLAKTGPLAGIVEQYFFDTNKLKTSSIVAYGLRPLVKTGGVDSLFSKWEHPERDEVANGRNDAALAEYIKFCVSHINAVLVAVKNNLSPGRWTTDRKVERRVLATTYVNSFLITIRMLIEKGHDLDPKKLERSFAGIDDFDFGAYHSSQYKRMAARIVETHFR